MYDSCYFYEERIPNSLRDICRRKLNENKLTFKECNYTMPIDRIDEILKECKTVLFAPGRYLPEKIFANNNHLKLMQIWSSGFDKFNLTDASNNNIRVANNGGANAISVAEHTLMLMLSVSRKISEMSYRAKNGIWSGNSHGIDMHSMVNKTVGIIGLGNIGSAVAKRCLSFDTKILYYDIDRKLDLEKAYGYRYVELDQLVSESDYISVHLHLNKNTHLILNKELLKKLKKSAFIINVSRSQLIDINYLTELLEKKEIAGAALDVFEKEPTTGYERILNIPTCLATPHTAGSTLETYYLALQRCCNNIKKAINEEVPLYLVN